MASRPSSVWQPQGLQIALRHQSKALIPSFLSEMYVRPVNRYFRSHFSNSYPTMSVGRTSKISSEKQAPFFVRISLYDQTTDLVDTTPSSLQLLRTQDVRSTCSTATLGRPGSSKFVRTALAPPQTLTPTSLNPLFQASPSCHPSMVTQTVCTIWQSLSLALICSQETPECVVFCQKCVFLSSFVPRFFSPRSIDPYPYVRSCRTQLPFHIQWQDLKDLFR